MALPVVVVSSGGMAVTETASGIALPVEVATNGFGIAVTVVSSGGLPVVGIGGGGFVESLDFSDDRNSQYVPVI